MGMKKKRGLKSNEKKGKRRSTGGTGIRGTERGKDWIKVEKKKKIRKKKGVA